MPGALCGLWVDEDGCVHTALECVDGKREVFVETLRPFAWLKAQALAEGEGVSVEALIGDGVFNRLLHAETLGQFELWQEQAKALGGTDVIRPLESQYLLQSRRRLFAELPFSRLRRCQLDIETGSTDGSFSDATKAGDRVLAIGLRCGGENRFLVLGDDTPAAEKALLEQLNATLAELDPDTLEGHNIFKFDLDFLRLRAKRHKVPCAWGRFGQPAKFRNSRLKVAERMVDFPRCDLPGRTVVDTYLLVQLHDISAREMTSYGLKAVATYLGITDEDDERTYLAGDKIQQAFNEDRATFLAYLGDDLRETAGVADLLLPTYFEQVKTFPILLQEATLRGTTSKIDLLFQEEYYHARRTCPIPPEMAPFEGGYTRSFQEGVFRHVLHFDVASLYPSLLLLLDRNPRNDALGVFIPLLRRLREYRLKYKALAKTGATADERAEAQARQASFKILINSFYGYLGFSGARFGDGELAADVTRRGRELLQQLIDGFAAQGCLILEADTDGIYLSSEKHYAEPEQLLATVASVLPAGIELEHDGSYEAMFCYKSKNYALREGSRMILRGSALRSRGIERFLQELTGRLIRFLLGLEPETPLVRLEQLRAQIAARELPVAELAKAEVLSMNPDAYERMIAEGGKPRRASAEAALLMSPRPRMGERVSYYLAVKAKGQTSDWQRARPVAAYDPVTAPYDPKTYLEKLDDWLERYGPFLGVKPAGGEQGDLFS
ncbi:DNA polymerase [Verrucomicrobia bacterium IMCC26134]|nr:DNA polymerase [Verrucomicrobia bacterium IMCC26134]